MKKVTKEEFKKNLEGTTLVGIVTRETWMGEEVTTAFDIDGHPVAMRKRMRGKHATRTQWFLT